jgi:hypothetical protein
MRAAILPGAQTERRGGAGPVKRLLDRKDLNGHFVFDNLGRSVPSVRFRLSAWARHGEKSGRRPNYPQWSA